jgi:hypothetical protein
MVEHLQSEYLQSSSALVETLKNGSQRVTKKSVKELHPFIKDDIADFVNAHPEVLDIYKTLKGAENALDNNELDYSFDEASHAQLLIDQLSKIAPGNDAANQYHDFAMSICTFLFFPQLAIPIKEFQQHQGRKRVDFKYTNTAKNGFFYRMLAANQTRAISVFFECKNYTREIANPDLDQLSGRFGHQRGFFGFLLCRGLADRKKVIAECRDTASDGRGYKLVFEDRDLIHLLALVRDGRRSNIDPFLTQRFDEISN